MTARPRELRRETLVRLEAAHIARARVPPRNDDVWAGLAAGKWSFVDHFQHGGRWYFVARHNRPAHARPPTAREWRAWVLAAEGQPNKLIADALGVSAATVATYLARARRKLGGGPLFVILRSLMPKR
jgi:DNA-binding NarL/FixJ family response regulator